MAAHSRNRSLVVASTFYSPPSAADRPIYPSELPLPPPFYNRPNPPGETHAALLPHHPPTEHRGILNSSLVERPPAPSNPLLRLPLAEPPAVIIILLVGRRNLTEYPWKSSVWPSSSSFFLSPGAIISPSPFGSENFKWAPSTSPGLSWEIVCILENKKRRKKFAHFECL